MTDNIFNDPFMDLIQEQIALERRVEITETKETPIYQKGTFVPAWVGSTTAGTFTYTANQTLVEWTRNGNRVDFNGRIVITAIGVAPVGTLTITGFPFTAVSDANMFVSGGGPFMAWAFNVAAGYTDAGLYIPNGAAAAVCVKSGDNLAIANVTGGELIVGDCRFAGCYRIAN